MPRSIKNLLNFQFLLFLVVGYVLITFVDRIEHEAAIFVPPLLVLLYAVMIRWGLTDCPVSRLATKRIDSIYLVGFLYSLLSVVVLAIRLKELSSVLPERYLAAMALSYLAISLISSLAAMAGRTLVRHHYLKSRGQSNPEIRVILAGE